MASEINLGSTPFPLRNLLPPPVEYGQQAIAEKTIWSFWHSGIDGLTPLHRLCIGSWQAQNPQWDIRVMDRGNVHAYVPDSELTHGWDQIESPAHQADAARLAVLKLYGGVYVDISIILMTSLDKLAWQGLSDMRYGYVGFYNPDYGVGVDGREAMAPWFMASKAKSPFISRWHEVFNHVMHGRRNVDNLSNHPMLRDIDLTNLKEFKDYLAMNSVLKRLIDTEPEMRSYWEYCTRLLNTNSTGYKWRSALNVQAWYTDNEMDGFIGPEHTDAEWEAIQEVPLVKLNNAGGGLNKCDYPELLNGHNLISRIFDKALYLSGQRDISA